MLDIAASYHSMQFQGKLKLAKKLVSGPILAHLTQIWAPNFFFFFFQKSGFISH